MLSFIPLARLLFLLGLVTVSVVMAIAWGGASPGDDAALAPTPEPTLPPPPATATATATPEPTATPSPIPEPTATPIVVAELPIIDLHFHPEPAWGDDLGAFFDQIGVKRAGSGAAAGDDVALNMAQRFPGRVVPFTGGPEARRLIALHGEAGWKLQAGEMETYLRTVEAKLAEGVFRGIGEVHVNNWGSNIAGTARYLFPADSPLMQRLFELSARYQVPLSVHMDAELESVQSMERLLAANRDGIWLWAHTGHYAPPDLLRRLFTEHENLYCELSYRTSSSSSRTAVPMDTNGVLHEAWRELLNDFPERFVIGTDLVRPDRALYVQHIGKWRTILSQLEPEAAAQIAYRNAEALLGIVD